MTIEVENGTLCPNCKKKALVEARTRENNPAVDGMKCKNCDSLYRWNESHHLIPFDPLAVIISASPAPPLITNSAKTIIPLLVPVVTESEVVRRHRCHRLTSDQKEEVKQRLLAGDRPQDIARDMHVNDKGIYPYRMKLGIHGRLPRRKSRKARVLTQKVVKVSLEDKPQPIEPKKKPAQVHNNMNGNVMSMMARLQRGEIRTRAARPVLSRYKEMLEGELKAKLGEVKELKQKINAMDDALNALGIIEKGEKDIVDKVLVAVMG